MNETANRSAKTDTKVINFSDFVGSMDGKDDGKIKDGTSFYSASYKGQKDGQKVKKGTHVHCNRFNGTKSDHRCWSKKHPKAYVCLLYTSPSPRDGLLSRMPSSA